MLLQFFKKQRLNWQAYLLIYALALKAIWVYAAVVKSPEILQNSWLESFLPQPASVVVSVFVALGIIYICAILINGMVNRHGLLHTGSNLPAMSLILLAALATPLQGLSLFTLLVLFTILILNKLYKASLKEQIEPNVFDISFLAGLGSLLFFPFALYGLAVMVAIPFVNIPKKRYFGISLVGFLIPWYAWAIYKFFVNDLHWFVDWFHNVQAQFLAVPTELHWPNELGPALIVIVFVLTLVHYLSRIRRIPPSVRSYLICAMIFVGFGIAALVLFPGKRLFTASTLVVPLAVLLGHTFYSLPKTLASVLHLTLIVGAILLPLLLIF